MNRLIMLSHVAWLALCASALVAGEPAGQSSGPKPSAPVSYQVRNKKFGQLLRPEEARGANGTPIVLYPAQPWKCMTWKFHSAGESTFYLQNHFTSKTFAVAAKPGAEESAVTQVPFAKDAAERPAWQVTKLSDGSYKLVEAKSGKALTAVLKQSDSEVTIKVEPWQDKDEQKWELLEIDPKTLTM
jgi:hypothetical protein